MRKTLQLTYQGFEVSPYNQKLKTFKFTSDTGREYIYATTGNPRVILDMPQEIGKNVLVTAIVKSDKYLSYLRINK